MSTFARFAELAENLRSIPTRTAFQTRSAYDAGARHMPNQESGGAAPCVLFGVGH